MPKSRPYPGEKPKPRSKPRPAAKPRPSRGKMVFKPKKSGYKK